jgi:hypothetical protein
VIAADPLVTLEFLHAWFGETAQGHVVAWSPDEDARWYPAAQLDRLAADSLAAAERTNIYFGLATQPRSLGPHQRGKAATTSGIGGVWIEVDFGTDGHKKGSLPPTLLDALALIHAFPLAPTYIILSGHGLHAYWLFREFWRFDSDSERDEAADLVYRFQATIRARAEARGWEADSTHDLARVLRLPGTWNRKPGLEPIPVRVIEEDLGCRYSPDEFEPYLLDVDWSRRNRGTVAAVQLPEDLPKVDIDGLLIRDRIKRLVREGANPERHASRSEAQWAALTGLVEDEQDDTTIAALFFNPEHAIGAAAREKGRRWFAQDLARARAHVEGKAGAPHTWPTLEQVTTPAPNGNGNGHADKEEQSCIPTSRLRELLAAEAERNRLRAENERLRAEVGRAVRREKVAANTHLKGAAKAISVAAIRVVMARARKAEPGQPVSVNFRTIARMGGASDSAVSSSMKTLTGPNGVLIEASPDWISADPDGVPYPYPHRVNRYIPRYATEEEMLDALAKFEPEKADGKADWGGKREKAERIMEARCEDHPAAGTDLRCRECDALLMGVREAEGPYVEPSRQDAGMGGRGPDVVSKSNGHLGGMDGPAVQDAGMGRRRRWFDARLPAVDSEHLMRATAVVINGADIPEWVKHGDWATRSRWERQQWQAAAGHSEQPPAHNQEGGRPAYEQ